MKNGFLKVASVTPTILTGDIDHNTKRIIANIIDAHSLNVQVAVFSELCITGKELGDMSCNPLILKKAEEALKKIAECTSKRDITCFVGLPLKFEGNIYNAVACISRGLILGLTTKEDLTKDEMRYYCDSPLIEDSIELCGFIVPCSDNLIYSCGDINIAVNFSPYIDYKKMRDLNANIVAQINTAKYSYSKSPINYLRGISKAHSLGIIEAGGNIGESTSTSNYLPIKNIYECGVALKCLKVDNKEMIISDIDIEKIDYIKSKNNLKKDYNIKSHQVEIFIKKDYEKLDREFDAYPFMLKNQSDYDDMLTHLAIALHHRVNYTKAKTLIIGSSGGVDSSATMLVAERFCDIYDFDKENVICITLPSFVSNKNTLQTTIELINALGFTHKNINISDSIKKHLGEIGHDLAEDITYENSQARERTQILMDFANMTNGIMLGTSDMSEEAIGFSTYGGDQMSMINVVSGACKTTLKGLIDYSINDTENESVIKSLSYVLSQPISPELKSGQETEKIIGSYDLHDFALYNFLANGYSPKKIIMCAELAFPKVPQGEIENTINIFFSRFFKAQYKRNACADSMSYFDVSLSSNDFSLISDFYGDDFI